MKLEFGYGKGIQEVEIDEKNLLDVLTANDMEHKYRGKKAVSYALDHPICSHPLEELVKGKKNIVIITSDISRPMPTHEVLPVLLDRLYKAGIEKSQITVVFALGSHRKHTDDERRKLAGDKAFFEVKCVDSDVNDCINMGTTKNGTPVDITRVVAEADFKICLGNIEYHYFAGYSGGAKAIMPGVSTPAAIQENHRLMVLPECCAGNLEGNPLRMDIEEAGDLVGIDFILNVVLDEHKKIVYAIAGDVTKAHREGCKYIDQMYRKDIKERADIVIVSQGGAPKDANLYQTQKALDNSKHAVKKGGTIILLGACNEGMGSKVFEEWLNVADRPQALIERLNQHFVLGGHKAAAIGLVMENAEIMLISEMDDDYVRSIFFTPEHSLQEAYDKALKKHGKDATVIAMPFGGSTLPHVEK